MPVVKVKVKVRGSCSDDAISGVEWSCDSVISVISVISGVELRGEERTEVTLQFSVFMGFPSSDSLRISQLF